MIKWLSLIVILFYVILGKSYAQDSGRADAGQEVILMEDEQSDSTHEKQNNIKLDFKERWKYGSVFYKEKVFGWMATALQAYQKNTPLEILLPTIFPSNNTAGTAIEEDQIPIKETNVQSSPGASQTSVAPVEPPQEIASFYLNSILYFGDNDWAIWMDGKKTKQGDQPAPLQIIQIDESQASFLWKSTRIDERFPGWRDYLIPLDDDKKFYSNTKNIVVNSENGDISFVMKPNQSFIPKELKIVEGAVKAGSVTAMPVAPMAAPAATPQNPTENTTPPQNSLPDVSAALKGSGLDSAHMDQYVNQLNNLKNMMDAFK